MCGCSLRHERWQHAFRNRRYCCKGSKTTEQALAFTHNDAENAVANSLMAVGTEMRTGAGHNQRIWRTVAGNANLCSIIPECLLLKMGCKGIKQERLAHLRELSLFVDEMSNFLPDKHRPFVGDSAFAHKGGIHVSAIRRNPETYEHIEPNSLETHKGY